MRENSVSRGSTNGAVGSEIKLAGNDNKDKMYEPKHKRKLVRVLTVIGYIFSVSLAAIMLSLFYMFIYNPGKPVGDNEKVQSTSGSQNLATLRGFQLINEDSLNILNDTYFNSEREEPRALPLEPMKTTIQGIPENLMQNKSFDHSNVKFSGMSENKTSLHRILKVLKLH